MGVVRNYAELARLSNLPTVISNTLVGIAIGLHGLNEDVAWMTFALLAPAMAFLYVGGMALNDIVDEPIDRAQRANRPIPQGRVSRRGAWVFTITSFLLGAALLAACGLAPFLAGLALLTAIILYDLLHKKHPATSILMGLCRGLVYFIAAVAVAWPLEWRVFTPLAVSITVYVVLITLIARGEAQDRLGISQRLAMLMLFVAAFPALFIFPDDVVPMIAGGVLIIGWLVLSQRHLLVRPPRMKQAVMAWLAGIALLDAFFLTLLDQPILAGIAAGCFIVTALAHRVIMGT